ncbi:hypothetical protein ACFVJS_04040 [Nocardioides sp. NPDC057772]|uniref:hypothetical protein n=1 Tax=Nocardioides sp. NPDC057772 TaxID=3346245 RepID=UPI00366B79CF
MTCPQVSDEGLICTLTPGHLGDMHKDMSDPATEIQWRHPRPITLGELVADVEGRVRSRAAALLAQEPAPRALGHSATVTVIDELLESTDAEAVNALPALVAPVRPPSVLADIRRKFFPVRRGARGRAGRGNP